jgi:hypothetical protein
VLEPSPKSHVHAVTPGLESVASKSTVFVFKEIVGLVGEKMKSATSCVEAADTVTDRDVDAVCPRSFLTVSVTE